MEANTDSQDEIASIFSSSNGILKFERQFAYGTGGERTGNLPAGGATSPGYLIGINTITGISDYSGSTLGLIRTAGVAGLSKGSSVDARVTHIGLYGSSSNTFGHYSGYFVGGPVYSENSISASGLEITKGTDGGNTLITVLNSQTDTGTDKGAGIRFQHAGLSSGATVIGPAGMIVAGKDGNYQNLLQNQKSNLQFFTTFNGVDTEKMRIDNTGNVGIGTTDPVNKLQVEGDISASGNLFISGAYFGAPVETAASSSYIKTDSAGSLGNENLWINAGDDIIMNSDGGNVGIKYGPYPFINPPLALSVNGSIFLSGSNQSIYFTNHSTLDDTYLRIHHNMSVGASGGTYFDVKHHSGADGSIYFRGGGDAKDFTFDTDNQVGTTVTWTSTSDKRLKDNIIKLDNGIDVINKLEPVSFEWNEKSGLDGKEDIGLIAQDVLKVVPEVVEQNITEDTDYYSVTYGKLVPHLIKAVQEQQVRGIIWVEK